MALVTNSTFLVRQMHPRHFVYKLALPIALISLTVPTAVTRSGFQQHQMEPMTVVRNIRLA